MAAATVAAAMPLVTVLLFIQRMTCQRSHTGLRRSGALRLAGRLTCSRQVRSDLAKALPGFDRAAPVEPDCRRSTVDHLRKDDWLLVQQRFEAWWAGDMLDRPILLATAPRAPADPRDVPPANPDALFVWFTDPEIVIPRLEREVARTCYGGDAFPLAFPMSPALPAIEAAYLGCPYKIVPGGNTGWADPLISDWGARAHIQVDPENPWWRTTQVLLEAGARKGAGRYVVGIPDLQGGGQIVALLRGTEQLAVDLVDHPDEVKLAADEEILAWRHYYDTCFGIIHRYQDGYVDWLGVWSDRPYVTVENDFSVMISPRMFEEFFVPALEQQTEWVERSIFHLDGPGAIRHLDLLLELPRLDGIQWVPGSGAPAVSTWLPLLKRIQARGKRLVLNVEPGEVIPLLEELDPRGVILSSTCPSVAEVDRLLGEVERVFGTRS